MAGLIDSISCDLPELANPRTNVGFRDCARRRHASTPLGSWVPGAGFEPARLDKETADFKSAAAANFATRARYPERLSRYAAAHSDTMRSKVVSGTRPDPSTVSWKPLISNPSPIEASASRRIRWISSRPSMYDNA